MSNDDEIATTGGMDVAKMAALRQWLLSSDGVFVNPVEAEFCVQFPLGLK